MKKTLNYIRRIEEMRSKYLNNYFSAGQVDAIFSKISKVRKQTADGNTFECKYYFGVEGHSMDFKVLVRNCGATLKPTGAICPITNKPMSAKVKQYRVVSIDLADGISRYIEKLKERYAHIEDVIEQQFIPQYDVYVSHSLIRAKMYNTNSDCSSINELEEFLAEEYADGKSITLNNSTIVSLFNSSQISLRLARYLHNYMKKHYSKEIVFNYVDMTEAYNHEVQKTKDYIKDLQNYLVQIESDIKEWEEIKGLYS